MAITVTWLGHACWLIDTGPHKLLVDPFLDDNESAPIKADAVAADYILITHGHFDHCSDAAPIAQRTGATLVASFEICNWFAKQGVTKTEPMNLGGSIPTAFGRVKMTPAWHSSELPDGTYGGNPSGYLVTMLGRRIYIAGDTALFSDMQLLARGGVDLAILPIGDRFTMGPEDALEAVKLVQPRLVAPSHYNTWPPIAQDASAWAKRVVEETQAQPFVVLPGESFRIE